MKRAEKAPQPKPKPNAGPNAPVAGQGQRLSSSETRFKTLNSKPNPGSLGTCDRCRRLDKQGKLVEALRAGTLP